MKTIQIYYIYHHPIDKVFKKFADSENYGDFYSAKFERIKDAPSGDKDSVGSIRKINTLLASLEETITTYDKPKTIIYEITKGGPLKNHKGIIKLIQNGDKVELDYEIKFEGKFILIASILRYFLSIEINRAVKKIDTILDSET